MNYLARIKIHSLKNSPYNSTHFTNFKFNGLLDEYELRNLFEIAKKFNFKFVGDVIYYLREVLSEISNVWSNGMLDWMFYVEHYDIMNVIRNVIKLYDFFMDKNKNNLNRVVVGGMSNDGYERHPEPPRLHDGPIKYKKKSEQMAT